MFRKQIHKIDLAQLALRITAWVFRASSAFRSARWEVMEVEPNPHPASLQGCFNVA